MITNSDLQYSCTIIRVEYAYKVAALKYCVHSDEAAKQKAALVRKGKVPCWI